MKQLSGPAPFLLTLFRLQGLQRCLSWLLLLCFLPLATGCNYYRIKEEKTVSAATLSGLPLYKRFIVHQGANTWELTSPEVGEKALTGTLAPLPADLVPYVNARAGSPHRFKPSRKSTALNIVHLHVFEFSRGQQDKVSIPIQAIKRLDITDKDTGATVASYLLTGYASLTAAFTILVVLILLFKSSCPFIYVKNEDGYRFVGEAYGGAIFSPLERDDYMPLPGWKVEGGKVQLKIANELKERQYTNLATLQVVQHPAGLTVLADQHGQPHTIQQVQAPAKALASDGQDYATALATRDSSGYYFNHDQVNTNQVRLQFSRPAQSRQGKLVLHAQNSLWLDYLFGEFTRQFGTIYNRWAEKQKDEPAAKLQAWQHQQGIPLQVEVLTRQGWQVAATIPPVGPLAGRDLVVPLDLSQVSGRQVQVRLSCGFMFWELDRAGMDFSADLPLQTREVKPATAFDKAGQDVRRQLSFRDQHYLQQLAVGDAVELTYVLPQAKPGQAQSLFLHTRGYYEHVRDYEGLPDLLTLRTFEKPGRFMQFSRERHQQLSEVNKLPELLSAHVPAP
ncbi:MAG: hypothetical protein ACO1NZ_15050 [Adhaeribacter sp.]